MEFLDRHARIQMEKDQLLTNLVIKATKELEENPDGVSAIEKLEI